MIGPGDVAVPAQTALPNALAGDAGRVSGASIQSRTRAATLMATRAPGYELILRP